MKKFVIGISVGVIFALGTTVFAESIKQYILKEASYPIIVNGIEYQDNELPILNYEGSTYVPLAKLGDLTGVDYAWNGDLRQVEILTSTSTNISMDEEKDITGYDVYVFDSSGNLRDAQGILAEEQNIMKFMEENSNYVIVYDDLNEQSKIEGEEASLDLLNKQIEAAKITETWIDEDTLYKKADISIGLDASGNPTLDRIIYGPYELSGRKKLHAYTLPENWQTGDQNETIVGGIRMKREGNTDYYYVDDLYKVNIIPENFNEEIEREYLEKDESRHVIN